MFPTRLFAAASAAASATPQTRAPLSSCFGTNTVEPGACTIPRPLRWSSSPVRHHSTQALEYKGLHLGMRIAHQAFGNPANAVLTSSVRLSGNAFSTSIRIMPSACRVTRNGSLSPSNLADAEHAHRVPACPHATQMLPCCAATRRPQSAACSGLRSQTQRVGKAVVLSVIAPHMPCSSGNSRPCRQQVGLASSAA